MIRNGRLRTAACLLPLALIFLLVAPVRGQELLQPGDAFPALVAVDQHEVPFEFRPGFRRVLIAFDMAAGKAANRVLAGYGTGFLEHNAAVFIANIHGMPAVGRLFALPKMRRYPHRIILADTPTLLAPFPQHAGELTLLRLAPDGVIESIHFLAPDGDLEADLSID